MEGSSPFNLNIIKKDALNVIKTPVYFYQNNIESSGYLKSIIFVIIMALVSAIIITFFSLLSGSFNPASLIGTLLFVPVMLVIGSFISALIVFIVWKVMGSDHSYQISYHCVAYSMAIMPVIAVLSFIPYTSIIGTVWASYLMIIASTEVHGIGQKTAIIVFVILGLIGVISNIAGEMLNQQMIAIESQMNEPSFGL